MRKQVALAVLTLLALAISVMPSSTFAQQTSKDKVVCTVEETEAKIKHIAKKVVKNEVDEEV